MSAKLNPVMVEVHRGDVVESIHRGSAVVADARGEVIWSKGEIERNIYPRSALKFFQALPLVESGAADHFGLSDKELAVACASHNAEDIHVETVQSWLQRLDLGIDDLECGPDLPGSESARKILYQNHKEPLKIHQNCSGKHAGMLTMCRFLDCPTRGYSEYGHPVQQRWMATLSEVLEFEATDFPWERDGCGMPAITLPMDKLAMGCARFAEAEKASDGRGRAMAKILSAVRAHPVMLAGTHRCCSAVVEITQGRVLVKTGAEGVFTAVVPGLGLGVALKIDDGATRASEVALGAVLKQIGAITDDEYAALGNFFQPRVRNTQGRVTGKILPSAEFRGSLT